MKLCEKCNKKHKGIYGSGRFCSSLCARTFSSLINRTERNLKISKAIKQKLLNGDKVGFCKIDFNKKVNKKCEICKCNTLNNKRFCSQKCQTVNWSKKVNSHPNNLGGYRQNSGRSKSGYYKGIFSNSTYELCWIIYRLEHNLFVKRFEGFLTNGKLKYFPDFILDDNKTIVEIKGFEDKEKVKAKTKLAKSLGYKVILLYEKDLQKEFKFVFNKFGTKDFKTLYDGYKPKFELKCNHCNKTYFKDKKPKTERNFCSRSCSGKYLKIFALQNKNKISKSLKKHHRNK
jgi:hypothetical protein